MDIVPLKKRSLSDEVREYLQKFIQNMDLSETTKLPPEETIAQNLGVSRVTIRKALSDLEQEGVIFRVHGRGTFVNREALEIKVNINQGYEIKQLIENSGYKASVEVVNLEILTAGYNVAKKLQIDPKDFIVCIERIFYADGNPAILCIDRFPCKLIPDEVTEEDTKISTFELLRQKAGKIALWDKTEIRTVSKQSYSKSSYIGYMENDSFLELESVNFDKDNCPILFVTEIIDTNYIRFNLIRQKDIKYEI